MKGRHKTLNYFENFINKIYVDPINECWIWVGAKNDDGYGRFWNGERLIFSHRYAYEYYRSKIPKDLTVDHLCRNRICCNPKHLELVTRKENLFRSPIYNGTKTHCNHGHAFTGENLHILKNGNRVCKECNKISVRNYKRRLVIQ